MVSIVPDRTLGILAQATGNHDQAATHFEDALSFCRNAGYRPELAWTCCDYADALVQRGHPEDLGQALSLINESLATAVDLGMSPLAERAAAVKQRVESQPVTAPSFADGLTRREVEVLSLVTAGKTDREIAEELIISVRTVTTHVSNIFNKIGVANRVEAAAYAIRQGLSV